MDISSFILSKRYIEDSLEGAGALVGKSAYEIACENGFFGTPVAWLKSLKGDTPEIGPNGTWVIGDKDTGVVASPSLAGYATEAFVKEQIANISGVDLSEYATREELSSAILGIKIPDVSGFATKKELEEEIRKIEIPDLSLYATKTYVKELIDAIEMPEGTFDMTPLTQQEVLDICQ